MKLGKHINVLNEINFEKICPELHERVRVAYFGGDVQEFNVVINTDGKIFESTFTASAIVQLTNQDWVKHISPSKLIRSC